MFASPWAATQIYSLDLSKQSPTWAKFCSIRDAIWNVFTLQGQCCIRTGAKNKIYCLSSGEYNLIATVPSTISKGFASLIARDNRIYKLGGYKGDCLNTAAVCDVEGDKEWNDLPKMPFRTCWCSSAVVDHLLYVGGGCVVDAHRWNPIRNIAVLDLRSRDWQSLPLLEHYNATISSIGENIVACGGCNERSAYDRDHDGKQVSVLDMRSRRWFPLLSTSQPHSRHGMCSIRDGSLAVVAGKDNNAVELLSFN